MKLFTESEQTSPKAMLNDVITLYTLQYGVNRKVAAQYIRMDLRENLRVTENMRLAFKRVGGV